MHLVQFGAERIAKGLSLAGSGGPLYWEPFVGVVVETEVGWVLLDTGMGRPALDDPRNADAYAAAAAAYGQAPDGDQPDGDQPDGDLAGERPDGTWHLHPEPPAGARWTWGWPGDPLEAGLAEVGLHPRDLVLAAVSHLHLDHSGGIPTLAASGVPVAVQRAELEFARSGLPGLGDGYHAPDWSDPRTRWELLDGDAELAPGVLALSTPGHTPGHMSYAVDLPETGRWIFAADAADLAQNLYDRTPPGTCAGGTPADEQAARESLERLLAEARTRRARLVPGHDQVVLNAVRAPADGHR
jgi:glyoxylase-like metal-dependent hydrolase (beta-lactamase superfamily II)